MHAFSCHNISLAAFLSAKHGVSLQQDEITNIIPTRSKEPHLLSLTFLRCSHACVPSAKSVSKVESGGWTCGCLQRPQGIRPPRRREGSQEIAIASNGPGTLLKDRYQHPHFMCQESRAGRGQVIDSQSQGSEWSQGSNWVLHLSKPFLLHCANPCGTLWI